MAEKKDVRKYRIFLENPYGYFGYKYSQTALCFHDDGTVTMKVVPSKKSITTKDVSGRKTEPSTLAYIDSSTCEYKTFGDFLDAVNAENPGLDLWQGNYVLYKSSIGYFLNGRQYNLKPIFNMPDLSVHSKTVSRAKVTSDDSFLFIKKVAQMVKDPFSDYTVALCDAATYYETLKDGISGYKYSLSPSFLDIVRALHNTSVTLNENYSSTLAEDVSQFTDDFFAGMTEYKTFREVFRFTKDYLKEKKTLETSQSSVVEDTSAESSKPDVEEPAKQKKLESPYHQLTLWEWLENGDK